MSEVVQDFIAAMTAAGVVPAEPIGGLLQSGKLIRFRCQGDGAKRNGWAILFEGERPGGAYGNHKQNTGTLTWSQRRDRPIDPAQRERIRAAIDAEAERRAEARGRAQELAREEAARVWFGAQSAGDHPYLVRKRLRRERLRQSGEALLVPMRDPDGRLWNLQRIFPDGSKRFLKGGRISGLCAVIGGQPEYSRGVIVEGYATGDAVWQALRDRPVIVAFNTANLDAVVSACKCRRPATDWVIGADDDHLTGLKMLERGQPYQNPGVDKARAAAAAHSCRVAYPPSVRVRRWFEGDRLNVDFSDLFVAGDVEAIRSAIRAAHCVRSKEGFAA